MYTKSFEAAVDHLMLYEVGKFWNVNAKGARDGTNMKASGYVNDPVDPGGETKYGISKRANPDINIKNLNWEDAKKIYYTKYWLLASCDKISSRISVLHFDGAVNHGIGRAAKFLQESLNLVPDGIIGPKTLKALGLADDIEICNLVCDKREVFYKNIVENKPSQKKYINGWLTRIREMREYTTDISNNFI